MPLTTRQSLIELAQLDWNESLITIHQGAIERLDGITGTGLPSFTYMVNPEWSLRQMAAYWVYCAAQAFQFWDLQPDGSLNKYHYQHMTGSTAMFHCIRDHWIEGCLPERRVESAFWGAPAITSRIEIGVELSSQQDKLYELVDSLVDKASKGVLSVVDAALMAESFPASFTDPYLKKAQLALTAIGSLAQEHLGVEVTCDLTAFADYQVPRVLRSLGVIEYAPELAELVDSGALIESDSGYERAIRGATVVAVDRMANQCGCPAVVVDNMLWSSQELAKGALFHLTETTYY